MKRSTPMKPGKGFKPRQTPLRATAPAKADVKMPNVRKCKVCAEPFRPGRALQTWCSPECGVKLASRLVAKKKAKEAADDKRLTRAQLDAMKTLGELRKEAQAEFNRYIRHRDRLAGHGCICCGKPLNWNSTKAGGAVDAGHFVSRGSAPDLAFDERNVNAQDKGHNRPGGAKRDDFRAGMVARWGKDVVDELEGPYQPARLRQDDYRRIKAEYRRRANALAKEFA